jgi:hypothetical protein
MRDMDGDGRIVSKLDVCVELFWAPLAPRWLRTSLSLRVLTVCVCWRWFTAVEALFPSTAMFDWIFSWGSG